MESEAERGRWREADRATAAPLTLKGEADMTAAEQIAELAKQDWLVRVDLDYGDNTIAYRDPERSGCFVDLMTVPLGCTEENEDGEEQVDTEGMDVLNLLAVLSILEMVGLLLWVAERLDTLSAIHFDSANESGRLHVLLRKQVEALLKRFEDRSGLILTSGTHGLMPKVRQP